MINLKNTYFCSDIEQDFNIFSKPQINQYIRSRFQNKNQASEN
jgi:hypothetical protein